MSNYPAMNLHDRDLTRLVMIEATQQKAIEAAKNLLKMNILSPSQIAQAEGLKLEQVLELQKQTGFQHL